MPMRARASGMPTAQPTMRPMLDLDLEDGWGSAGVSLFAGAAVGVMTLVII
jgi:hypothetical protein